MSAHPAPLWRDPLFSSGDRFPLGPRLGAVPHGMTGFGVLIADAAAPTFAGRIGGPS
ncbi:MAG: hypothetical protein ACRDSZ_03910 [Pseudonocardiaceae bacterium]